MRTLHNQLFDMVHYNNWANQIICESIEKLTDVQFEQTIVSSFPSIRTTLLHIWDAQDVWLNRLNNNSPSAFPSHQFQGDKEEAIDTLLKNTEAWVHYFMHPGLEVEQLISFKDTQGTSYQQTISEITLHCMNHSTYHRGQLITMLRQLEISAVPSTDYIRYLRAK